MLRRKLLPPELNPEEVKHLAELGTRIIDYIDTGRDARPLIAQFNAVTGGHFDHIDFDGAAGSMSMQEFAEQVLTPRPLKVDDITDDELLEIIRRLLQGEATERETDYWLGLLAINIPNPHISDLIYWGEEGATPEEILAEARKWKPIAL